MGLGVLHHSKVHVFDVLSVQLKKLKYYYIEVLKKITTKQVLPNKNSNRHIYIVYNNSNYGNIVCSIIDNSDSNQN